MESSVITLRDLPSVRIGIVSADPVLHTLHQRFRADLAGIFQAQAGPVPSTPVDDLMRHATTLDLCLLSSRVSLLSSDGTAPTADTFYNALLGVYLPHCPVVWCDCARSLDMQSLGFGKNEPKFIGWQEHSPMYVWDYLVLPLLRSFHDRGMGRRKWVSEYPVFLYKLRRALNG